MCMQSLMEIFSWKINILRQVDFVMTNDLSSKMGDNLKSL